MKLLEKSALLLNCEFLLPGEYGHRILHALSHDKLTHIVTLNAEMVVEATHNEAFRQAVVRAELKIPDGSSMLWARDYLQAGERGSVAGLIMSLVRFLFSQERPLTGVDSIFTICEIVSQRKGTVYLLGGTEKELHDTAEVLKKKYPNLSIITTKEDFWAGSVRTNMKEGALFVAYGSPKQTLWIENNRALLKNSGIRIAMGVGGAFAMITMSLPRAPHILRRFHLEWLWRLILEPWRIGRIWNAVIVFPSLIFKGYPH